MTHEQFLDFMYRTQWKYVGVSDLEILQILVDHKQWIDEQFDGGSWTNPKRRLWEIAVQHNNLDLLKCVTEKCGSQWAVSEQLVEEVGASLMKKPCALIAHCLYIQTKDPFDMFHWIKNPLVEYIVQSVYADVDHHKILEDFRRCQSEKQLEFFVGVDAEVYPIRQRQKLLFAIEDNQREDGRGKRRM